MAFQEFSNINWQTVLTSIIGSSALAALITGLINYATNLRAIKESGLYAKRAEILDKLMQKFERLDRLIGDLVSPIQHDGTLEAEEARRKKAVEAFNSFLGFYKDKRHYLPKDTADEIEVLCKAYGDMFIDFVYSANMVGEKPDHKKWIEILRRYQKDFNPRRERIAQEFRKMVGVKISLFERIFSFVKN